jgi:uncharacterized membrane protein
MSVERTFEAMMGSFVLISVGLTWFVHPGFAWLTVFMGANLIQQAFTGFCPAKSLMRRFGMLPEGCTKTDGDIRRTTEAWQQ